MRLELLCFGCFLGSFKKPYVYDVLGFLYFVGGLCLLFG